MFIKSGTQMTHNFSLYLDIVRFIAALAVLLDHVSSYPFTKDLLYHPLGTFGGIAVVMFFVLSGYVIAYVTSTREKTFSEYAVARIARIYSVVLIALLITLIFDNIGAILNPEFYSIQKIMWKPQSIESYVSSLFFVNEYQIFNFNGIAPGSNAPYWSLSFEVTYYIIAGLFLYTRRLIAFSISILILFFAGRTIAALFPIWLLGYLLYFVELPKVNKKLLYIGFISTLFLIIATPYITGHLPKNNFGFNFPWGRGLLNRNLIEDYLTALFFSINLICVREILKDTLFKLNKKIEVLIRWLGSLTFPLYLIHYPTLAIFASISPWGNETIDNVAFISISTLVVIIIATPISNSLKRKIKEYLVLLINMRTAYYNAKLQVK